MSDVTTEYILPESLVPDPKHSRRMSRKEMESLTRSVLEFGMTQPLIARRENLELIDGDQRRKIAIKLGLKRVPVVLLDLTRDKAHLLGITLNNIQGEWDSELLARLVYELQHSIENLDLTLTGFDDRDIATLLKSLDQREKRHRIETFDYIRAIERPSSTENTEPGNIWGLDEHRIACIDATDQSAIDRLLAGEVADMGFLDPPYNVDYQIGAGTDASGLTRSIKNDRLSAEQWELFVSIWVNNLLHVVIGAIYVCMSAKEWPVVSGVLNECGAKWSDTIIWVKDRFTLGRADYQRGYEPIWYGWPGGSKHQWAGGRAQSDVWHIPRPSESPLHPTMKPVELVERAIENSSKPGDTVLDLFAGSGSTLIACERTGRIFRGAEIDPTYVDTIIARWEAFTGRTAQKVLL